MAQFLSPPLLQLNDASAVPLVGAKLFIYETNTTTLLDLFSDEDLNTGIANPIIADAAGVFAGAFVAETKFKVILKTSADVTLYTRDPVYSTGQADNILAENVSFDGAGIGFSSTNVQDALVEMFNSVPTLADPEFTGSLSLTKTDPGAGSGPTVSLVRLSASPAANDLLGYYSFSGNDSAGDINVYAGIRGYIVDPTNAAEGGGLQFQTQTAGSLATVATLASGLFMAAATGGDKGAGTVNATAAYANGVRIGGAPDIILEQQQASGTPGGNITTSITQVVINTEVRDSGGIISLSSNRFTPTVDMWIEWSQPIYGSTGKTWIYNVTDSAYVGEGTYANGSDAAEGGISVGGCQLTGGKQYELRVQGGQNRTNGLGYASGMTGTEVYGRIKGYRTA